MNSKSGREIALSLFVLVAILTTVSLQYRWNQRVLWEKPQIATVAYRGADGAARPPVFTAAQLAGLADLVQEALGTELALRSPRSFALTLRPRTEFRIATQVQELFEGGVAVSLSAHRYQDGSLIKTWSETYPSEQAFRDAGVRLGQTIASELAAL